MRNKLSLEMAAWGCFVILLLLLPAVVKSAYFLHILIIALVYAILSSSWNLVAGYTGVFSFAHHTFFGVGAYTSALFAVQLQISPWAGLFCGAAVATLFGLLIGLPVLRIKSLAHVAIVTLAFGEIVRILATNLSSITRGELGLSGIPNLPAIDLGFGVITFSAANRVSYYYLALVLFVACTATIKLIISSNYGLALRALRDDQDAARSLGVASTRYMMFSFLTGAFMAGFAGAFFAHYTRILTPSSVLDSGMMIEILAKTLIGGLGTFLGPIIGSFGITILLELLRDLGAYRLLIYGFLLVIIIMFWPKGLASISFKALRSRMAGGARHPVESKP